MSRSAIRKDKTCLNCRHVVENRFCPNCGQENTDTRKTFHHLFIHFFEDLTHYENAFWKTIRNLLFSPGALTREYLSGKRLSYLAPVRLYIFISFISFLLFAILVKPSDFNDKNSIVDINVDSPEVNSTVKDSMHLAHAKVDTLVVKGLLDKKEADLFKEAIRDNFAEADKIDMGLDYKSIEELNLARKNLKGEEAVSDVEYWFMSRLIKIQQRYTADEMVEKFLESLLHNFPKALFIYMPIFAFFLWLFHDKKRWYYFDHGIFTLHYFSFLILISLLSFLATWMLTNIADNLFITVIDAAITVAATIWMVYYFFPAHHRFYGENRVMSAAKSLALFIINMMLMSIILTMLMVYSFINIH